MKRHQCYIQQTACIVIMGHNPCWAVMYTLHSTPKLYCGPLALIWAIGCQSIHLHSCICYLQILVRKVLNLLCYMEWIVLSMLTLLRFDCIIIFPASQLCASLSSFVKRVLIQNFVAKIAGEIDACEHAYIMRQISTVNIALKVFYSNFEVCILKVLTPSWGTH